MRLALALLLFVFISSPGDEGKNQAKPIDSSGQSRAQAPDAPPVSSALKQTADNIPQPETQNQKPNPSPKPEPFMSHGEWIMSILTFFYVALTGVYVWYSRKTLTELQRQIGLIEKQDIATNRQLEISEKSANAALLSAQSLIRAERSWMLITNQSKAFDPFNLDLKATNHGNCPAEIIWVFQKEAILDPNESLPAEPFYGRPDIIFGHRQWLPHGKSITINDCNVAEIAADSDDGIWEQLRSGRKQLWVYGIVRYRDGLSPELHESRFCYKIHRQVGPMIAGPHSYNDCT
jgi:hypothetical protein